MTAQTSPDLPDSPQRRDGYAQGGISPEPIRMVEREGDEQFIPDVGHATGSDLALVARATGGGIRSAELIPAYEDDELPRISPRRDLSQLRSLPAQIAQLTADRNDWKARCEQAWGQLDQAQADLAAMTARAHTAEAVVDAGRRWLNAPSVEGDYSTEYELERAIVAHDGTGPLRPPASTLTARESTVEGSDAGNPENSSGGAA